MLTLHQATEKTKVLLKFGGIFLATIFLLLIVFRIGGNLKEHFFPTPLPPPTVSFGKLKDLEFPQNETNKPLTYSLNTLSGTLPKLSDRATVYKIIPPEANILALQKAEGIVQKIGFTDPPTALSESLYQWASQAYLSRKILLNIHSFDFNLSSDFLYNPEVLAAKSLPNENGAIAKAVSFSESLSLFPLDIDKSKTKTTLLTIKNLKPTPTTSLSTANLIRVDFFQKDINKFPIFYPHPSQSTMNVFIASGAVEGQVVEANFYHQNISEIAATYPIKTADEAFLELQKGKAYIASYFGEDKNVIIKDVFLGYYLGEKPQDYLMPIIIFSGDNGFFAYIQAVKDEWIGK